MISTIMIGDGGREDSLRWKLEKESIPIKENSEFVIIGPEGPIADGLTEHYEGMLKKVFAPSKLAGRLETSKLWAKQFMQRNDIPTAKWETYNRSTKILEIMNFDEKKNNVFFSDLILSLLSKEGSQNGV